MTQSNWNAQFNDSDLTFFMGVYRDYECADRTLRELRRHYPLSRVVVRSDGDDDPRHADLEARYAVDYRPEAHLFPARHGGAIVQRMLEIYAEKPTAFLFKIDPDTAIHRRFRFLPAREGCFGTLQGLPDVPAVQGGGLGISRDAALQLLESKLLLSPALRNPQSHRLRSRYWEILADRAARCGLASFDWSVGWAAGELGLTLFDFPEVRCTWQDPVDNSDLRFALTHPR